MILAGSIPSTLPSTIYMDIMKRLKDREIRIVVDASGELLRNVLVSMGGDGAILVTEDSRAHLMRAPKGEVVNSVGAGDSMVAGFIEGLRSGDYEIALRKAVCTGSASAFGDGLATKESVELLMASV